MNPRRLLFVSLALALLAALISAQNDKSPSSGTSDGLRVVTFPTDQGHIKVILPDDIRPGDTISGTVTTEPKGKDPTERKDNGERLMREHIVINDERWRVSDGEIHLTIPKSDKDPEMTLTDEQGKQILKLILALKGLGEAMVKSQNPDFKFPELAQSGRPYSIAGAFDGNSANTKVQIGDTQAKVIAESPRTAIVEIPNTVVGPNNISVNDNGNRASGSFRALKIDLTAPRTSLLKGESTELHVEVQGLQGISQPIPIQIQNQTPQNINITGGNIQNVIIQPSQVTSGGTFNWTTPITGASSGGFTVTGTIPTTTPTQTTASQPSPIATPRSPSSPTPNQLVAGMTSAEFRKRCDELQRQLNEAKAPCERKEKDCAGLRAQLAAAQAAADQAQADYDKAKAEFNTAMQNALNNLTAAARAKGFDTKLSLKAENKNYRPLQLAPGVVIYFDATGITDLQNADNYINNLANALHQMVSQATVNQLKQLAAKVAEADQKLKEALAARLAAKQALDKCAAERDALCPKVRELEAELDKCKKDAAAQAEAERQATEKAEAEKKAADEAERQRKDAAANAEAEAIRKHAEDIRAANEALEAAKDRAHQRQLCTDCLRFLLTQQAGGSGVSEPDAQALQQLSDALDKVNVALEKAGTASDILPASFLEQLEKLSDALGKIAELRDLANNINGIIAKIKQLSAGGNDPAQFATVLQLLSDALGMVAQRVPLLGPLANYFKLLADAGDAVINGLPNAIGAEAARKWGGMIDDWKCPAYAEFLHGYNGDLDAIYRRVFGAAERDIIARTPKAEEKLRAALLAKIQRCCLEWITKECSTNKR